jgi:hypothetical protein
MDKRNSTTIVNKCPTGVLVVRPTTHNTHSHDRFSSRGKAVSSENHCRTMVFWDPGTPSGYPHSYGIFLTVVYPVPLDRHQIFIPNTLQTRSTDFRAVPTRLCESGFKDNLPFPWECAFLNSYKI